jgi:hypothetical protein
MWTRLAGPPSACVVFAGAALALSGCAASERATFPPNPPRPPTRPGPPPAWAETTRGPVWLGYSSYCWKRSGCADYTNGECGTGSFNEPPPIRVEAGETIRIHFGFEPSSVSVAGSAGAHWLTGSSSVVWMGGTRPTSLLILRVFKIGRGDASYVACLRASH